MFHGVNETVIGESHIQNGIVCQDSSGVYTCEDFAIAVVADGHGSKKHFRSDAGSRIAVKVTMGLMKNYMQRKDFSSQFLQHPNFILQQMEKQVLMKWREAVLEYHQENPLSDEEIEEHQLRDKKVKVETIYGSTVLAAVLAKDFSFGLVLGDGGFVVMDEVGEMSIPVEDQNSHANYTSSLCNTNAINYFEHWFTKDKPEALFVSTDGLFKSFASEADFLTYHGLITKMFDNEDRMKTSLTKNFKKRTRDGSGDDISLSAIWR